MADERTLLDEGRRSGPQVARLAVLTTGLVVTMDVLLSRELTLFFDLSFITTCLVVVFLVHPRDFFVVGVLPPLLMLATVAVLAAVSRGVIADEVDGPAQAVVSGLAHQATPLVVGYALVLGVLALRHAAVGQTRPVQKARRPAPAAQRPHGARPGTPERGEPTPWRAGVSVTGTDF